MFYTQWTTAAVPTFCFLSR